MAVIIRNLTLQKGGAAVLPKPNWDVPVTKKTAEHHSNISEPKPSKAIKMQPQKSETIVPKQVNQRRTPMSQNQSKPPATVSSGWLAASSSSTTDCTSTHRLSTGYVTGSYCLFASGTRCLCRSFRSLSSLMSQCHSNRQHQL